MTIRGLLVDDEASFCEFLCELGEGVLELEACDSPHTALRRLIGDETWVPSIVLIDQNLHATLTGLDLVREIRLSHKSLPIVLLTSADEQDLAFEAGACGATAFANKDKISTSQHLHALIEDTLERSRELELKQSRHFDERYNGVLHLLRLMGHQAKEVYSIITQHVEAMRDLAERLKLAEKLEDPAEVLAQLRFSLDWIMIQCERGFDEIERVAELWKIGKALSIAPVQFDLPALIAEISKEVVPSGWVVDLQVTTGLVGLDRGAVAQIIRQVCSNSVKYASSGLRLEVKGTRRQVLNQRVIQLQVRDFGPGVPVEFRESIFEVGVVGDFTPKGRSNMGLGLSIAKSYAMAHRNGDIIGRIFCQTPSDGLGALFVIELPEV